MMKGNKRIVTLSLILSCTLQLFGCGNNKSAENGQGLRNNQTDSDAVYVAETQQIDTSTLSFVRLIGDTMYYAVGEQKEEAEEKRQIIYRLRLGETNPEKLPIDLEANVFVADMDMDAEGNLLFLLDQTGGGENFDTSSWFLNRYRADGTELTSWDLTDLGQNEEAFHIQYVAEDGQGNIYLSGDENSPIWILDHEGAQKGKIDNDSWINAMFTLPNGNVAIYYLDEAGKIGLSEIDTASKKLGKTYSKLPEVRSHFAPGRENTILMLGNSKIYEYDILTETYSEVLDLVNCGIDSNTIANISMLEDSRILVALLNWSEGEQKAELVCLTETQDAGVSQKEKIIFGTLHIHEELKQQVLTFNAHSDKYQIEIKEYGNGSQEDGETLLNAEITAGNGPDIIELTGVSDTTIKAYLSKGVLEDLNPWFDADEEIKQEDYIEQVLNAYQKDGKLYCIIPSFSIETVVGKTSDVGSKPGWTIDDVMALMDTKPEGTELFVDCTKDQVLRYCCTKSIDCFVDLETGVCNFNDGYFEKVLEFVNRFPEEITKKEDDDNLYNKIQNKEVLLYDINISSVADYQLMNQLFGEPITCIGLPVKEGSGSYIMSNRVYGINGNSKEKEGAWEFLRTFLMEDYQNDKHKTYTFPVLRSAFEAQLEEAMTPEYVEDGGPILMRADGTVWEPEISENGEKAERPKSIWNFYGWEALIFAADEEDVESVKALLEMTDGVYTYYTDISNIIEEETGPFFNGQKSAKEVADIIQSRVQVYVNENL